MSLTTSNASCYCVKFQVILRFQYLGFVVTLTTYRECFSQLLTFRPVLSAIMTV